jgi:hypothetical protein
MDELLAQGKGRAITEFLEWLFAHSESLWASFGATRKHLAHAVHFCEKTNHACEHAVETYAPWPVVAIVGVVGIMFVAHLKSH